MLWGIQGKAAGSFGLVQSAEKTLMAGGETQLRRSTQPVTFRRNTSPCRYCWGCRVFYHVGCKLGPFTYILKDGWPHKTGQVGGTSRCLATWGYMCEAPSYRASLSCHRTFAHDAPAAQNANPPNTAPPCLINFYLSFESQPKCGLLRKILLHSRFLSYRLCFFSFKSQSLRLCE